jgi:endoglucanase Acf2
MRDDPMPHAIHFRFLLCTSLLLAPNALVTHGQDETIVELGAGSYHGVLPDGRDRPTDSNGTPVLPSITDDFVGAVPTSDWSSSIVFPRYPGNDHGQPMFPWPLAVKTDAEGIRFMSAPSVQPVGNGYSSFLDTGNDGIHVGIDGLFADRTELAADGDWTITTECRDEARSLRATFGRGLPYAWIEIEGGDAVIETGSDLVVIEQVGPRIVFTTGTRTYAAFGPEGSSWSPGAGTLRSGLEGRGWLVIAVLPDSEPDTIELFDRHARAKVIDTTVSWSLDETSGTMLATYTFTTAALEGVERRTLTGLFPHQSPWNTLPRTGHAYDTARGVMELVVADAFTLALPVAPILPGLPVTEGMQVDEILTDLQAIAMETDSINAPDSYWAGKQLGRIANAAHIAETLGETALRQTFVDRLRVELEDWLSVGAPPSGSRIEAERYDSAEGVEIGAGEDGGSAVIGIGGGDRINWQGIDLAGAIPTRLLLRFASGVGSGGSALIELRLDTENGPLIGAAALGNTGGWDSWTTTPLGVDPDSAALLDGSRELVLLCITNHPDDILALDWIEWDLPGGAPTTKDLAYAPDWSTLLPSPGSYGIASELNDHHFHYGYMIAAAATVARFDPDWARPERWGAMVDLLVKDPANWDRDEDRFPFLRNLDPYMGHSYASGHAGFAAGNNQESSSEAMNFAQAVALWGDATGRVELRDLGLFLHALEAQAIEQYWFDADQQVYPEFMPHPIAGILWDAGVAYATWWTGNVEEIHGINLLPLTGGSLYLARRPATMERAWNHMVSENPGVPTVWQDILWSWRALFDPGSALHWFETDDAWSAEAGSSRAQVGFWIRSLATLGTLRTDVHADSPFAAVFERDGTSTWVAYNGGAADRLVVFSDGNTLCVPPGSTIATVQPETCALRGDLNGDGRVDGADLTVLLGEWGVCAPKNCLGDLDGDGVVGGADLTILLGAWS